VGLIAVVALALAASLRLAGMALPGGPLAGSIAERLICSAKLASCERSADFPLVAAYGEETAVLARRYAPELRYEAGSRAIPVDFRRCRSSVCGDGPPAGAVFLSDTGEQPTAFVHLLRRGGSTYIQYWLYYADSATLRGVPLAGSRGYHEDDWESFQVRIGPAGRGVEARASSHRGYNGSERAINKLSDIGHPLATAWTQARGKLWVSGGSHAGHAAESPLVRIGVKGAKGPERAARRYAHQSARVLHLDGHPSRWTPASRLRLVPIESLAGDCRRPQFAISAPWCKRVYADPEYGGTD
jgi:hypothetical protein